MSDERKYVEHHKYGYDHKTIPETKYNQSKEKCIETIKKDYQDAIEADMVLIEDREITSNSLNFLKALTSLRKEHFKNTTYDYRLHWAHGGGGFTHPPKPTDFNVVLEPYVDLENEENLE